MLHANGLRASLRWSAPSAVWAAVVACSPPPAAHSGSDSDGGAACHAGAEGCECLPDGACDSDLVCHSDRCVDAGGPRRITTGGTTSGTDQTSSTGDMTSGAGQTSSTGDTTSGTDQTSSTGENGSGDPDAPSALMWTLDHPMRDARAYFALLPISGGQWLAAGGIGEGQRGLATAETYEPGVEWARVASMPETHRGQTHAVALPGGQIMVVGEETSGGPTAAALFDPGAGTWTHTAMPPRAARYGATLNLLPDGRVLYAGGYGGGATSPTFATAETYDPMSGAWTRAHALGTARLGHSTVVLTVGPAKGLLVSCGGSVRAPLSIHKSCEAYHPATDVWSPLADMNHARTHFSLHELPDGTLLAVGGVSSVPGEALASVERYDPATNMWTLAAPLNSARAGHAALFLPRAPQKNSWANFGDGRRPRA